MKDEELARTGGRMRDGGGRAEVPFAAGLNLPPSARTGKLFVQEVGPGFPASVQQPRQLVVRVEKHLHPARVLAAGVLELRIDAPRHDKHRRPRRAVSGRLLPLINLPDFFPHFLLEPGPGSDHALGRSPVGVPDEEERRPAVRRAEGDDGAFRRPQPQLGERHSRERVALLVVHRPPPGDGPRADAGTSG
jgi:hypothetical protein